MGAILTLVQPTVSDDSLAAVQALLEKIKRGDVIGVAFVAVHRGLAYEGDATGAARQFPALTASMLTALEAEILSLPPQP